MPQTEPHTRTERPRTDGPSPLGTASDMLAAAGPHAFALPASHSMRLAQAAAAATGVLALLVLGLRFVDLREPQGDPAPPVAALDRTEVDLPSLTKPVRSDIPRFRGDAAPPVAEVVPDAPPESASAAPPVATEARAAPSVAHPPEHAA